MKNLNTQDLATISGGGCIPGKYGPGTIIICFPPRPNGPYNPFPDDFID